MDHPEIAAALRTGWPAGKSPTPFCGEFLITVSVPVSIRDLIDAEVVAIEQNQGEQYVGSE